MNFKFIIILIFSVCFISCANTNKAKDLPKMIGFQYIVDKYFNSYEAILNPAVIRPRNALATIHIPKKSLSKVEMNLTRGKLKRDGWVEVENYGNYSEYCLNKYQKISMLYPMSANETTKSGIPINYEDINSWSIGMYYNENGVNRCDQ